MHDRRRRVERLLVFPTIVPNDDHAGRDRGVVAVELRVLGYIGAFCSNIRNAKHMLSRRSQERPEVLRSIANPATELQGEWSDSVVSQESRCNEAQVLDRARTMSMTCIEFHSFFGAH